VSPPTTASISPIPPTLLFFCDSFSFLGVLLSIGWANGADRCFYRRVVVQVRVSRPPPPRRYHIPRAVKTLSPYGPCATVHPHHRLCSQLARWTLPIYGAHGLACGVRHRTQYHVLSLTQSSCMRAGSAGRRPHIMHSRHAPLGRAGHVCGTKGAGARGLVVIMVGVQHVRGIKKNELVDRFLENRCLR
jgi:hypothetical protein